MENQKPQILVTNRFDSSLKAKLPTFTEASFQYHKDLFAQPQLLAKAFGLIIRSSIKVDNDFLSKAKNLKFVVTATSGFDHIDLKATEKKGVSCFHIPETQKVAAAEMTILLILATARKLTLASAQLKKGDWQRSLLLGEQLTGKTLGVVGLGRVGKEVATRAKALGLKVQAFDPFLLKHDSEITMLGFEELLRSSDIVSLHVPKTLKTRHMIKKETLNWLASDATLINMSRGDVVNESDLIEHLAYNPQFKAGLDVFAKEPLVVDSKLQALPNVVLTPHVGASTHQALRASSLKSIEKALSFIKGETVCGKLPPDEPWYDQ